MITLTVALTVVSMMVGVIIGQAWLASVQRSESGEVRAALAALRADIATLPTRIDAGTCSATAADRLRDATNVRAPDRPGCRANPLTGSGASV